MGDSEGRTEYTPDQKQEIDRILDVLSTASIKTDRGSIPVMLDSSAEGITPFREEPTAPVEEEYASEEFEEEAVGDVDEITDVTDFIQVIEEPEERKTAREAPVEELPDITMEAEAPALPEIDEITEIPDEFEEVPGPKGEEGMEEPQFPELEEVEPVPAKKPRAKGAMSTEDALDELLSNEPSSVDQQDILDNRFIGEEGEEPSAGEEESLEELPEDLLQDIETADKGKSEMSLGAGDAEDVPDLSDMSLDSGGEIAEADVEDIPEIDIMDLTAQEKEPATRSDKKKGPSESLDMEMEEAGITASLDDLGDLGEIEDISGITEKKAPKKAEAEFGGFEEADLADIKGIDEIEDVVASEPIPDLGEIDMPEEEPVAVKKPSAPREEEGVELSDAELRKLKTALMLFHPALRSAIKDTILNDLLPPNDTRNLIDLVLKGKPEDNVHRFLEKKLNRTIDISGEEERPGRRVIASRPEYTKEGAERQKQLLKLTKIFGAAAVAAFLVTIMSYQFIYKPVMAKRKIREGVALIRKPGVPVDQKVRDYLEAEKLFQTVDEDYVKNYMPGYNQYARAYFDVKEYEYAYTKLNKAFQLEKGNIETLNNIGYFYARLPEPYYRRNYGRLKAPDAPEKAEAKIDIALRFYKYALNRDPKNITALYGIGNAYMYQGRYFEARQYYENILRVDKNSVVGYSGLLNLFIERDNFPEVLSIHSSLQDEELMEKVDSALLAKLAWYYLSKKRTDKMNVRIDYGVQSPRLKDLEDNPYPVVRTVLGVLNQKDPDYPPLYFHFARLAREQGNLKLMREYLKTAIKKEPNYFAAHYMMGEYYYLVKEPIEAYRSFKEAMNVYNSPPGFTDNDFYKETESLGKCYTMTGNLFYYFFDRLKPRYRYSDELEEVVLEEEVEKRANNDKAQEYYELAIKEKYSSPELHYNLGRLYYMKSLYEKALDQWLNLYEEFVRSPELMFSLGNAFFHLNNVEAAKGEYLKLISFYETEADKIRTIFPNKTEHIKIFQSLSSAYNNLGVIYQVQDNEVKSNLSYWKAIDYAKRIERENEFARVNLARSFKVRKEAIMPILDENIPFGYDIYRPDMRQLSNR